MPFDLNLEFIGLCALTTSNDGLELQVLLPDGRTPGLSYGNGMGANRKRFFVHIPYISFNFYDLYPDQRKDLDYVSKDAQDAPKKGFLILQGDVLGLRNYDTDTKDLNLNNYVQIPEMQEIYWETGGLHIDPSLTRDHNNVSGLVARMTFRIGKVSTGEQSQSKFTFTDRPPTSGNASYDNGDYFNRKVTVTTHITSDSVDLAIGENLYTFAPSSAKGITITIANMPPGRAQGENEFDITTLDDTKEDFDFELVYSVAYPKPSGKPRIPIRSINQDPPPEGEVPAGTYPPVICGLASYNSYDTYSSLLRSREKKTK